MYAYSVYHVLSLLECRNQYVYNLKNEALRERWERDFQKIFIDPVIGNLDTRLTEAMDQVINDGKLIDIISRILTKAEFAVLSSFLR